MAQRTLCDFFSSPSAAAFAYFIYPRVINVSAFISLVLSFHVFHGSDPKGGQGLETQGVDQQLHIDEAYDSKIVGSMRQ
jgi:hypothetical protein